MPESGYRTQRVPRFVPERVLLGSLSLLLLTVSGIGAELHASAEVRLSAIATTDPDPAGFATFGYRIENLAADSVSLRLLLSAPPNWRPLSPWRDLRLGPQELETVPFTLWIPSDASSDSSHSVQLSATRFGSKEEIASIERIVHVSPRSGLTLTAAPVGAAADAGSKYVVLVTLTNTGNATDAIDMHATSLPDWPVNPSHRRLSLRPAETQEIPVTVSIPSSAAPGTSQILTIEARSRNEGLPPEMSTQRLVRTQIEPRQARESRFPCLPLDASASIGESAPGQQSRDLRAYTQGAIDARTNLDLEVDLASGGRSNNVQAWRSRRFHLGLSRSNWEASVGDVTRTFPDLASRTLSGRGIGLSFSDDPWQLRFFGGSSQGRSESYSWAAGFDRTLDPKLRVGGNLLSLADDAGGLGSRRSRLACLTGEMRAPRSVQVRLETALSQTSFNRSQTRGGGAQLFVDHESPRALARNRLYAATRDFGGRSRDRDGILSYFRYSLSMPMRLWMNLEAGQGHTYQSTSSPWQRTTRYRIGSTYAKPRWPSLELTAGGLTERETSPAALRSSSGADASLGATYATGMFLGAMTGRLGHARNRVTREGGRDAALELTLGGRVSDWKGVAHWSHENDWHPDPGSRSSVSTLSGDLAWNPRIWPIQVGCGASSRSAQQPGVSPAQRETRFRPWIEAPLSRHVRLSVRSSVLSSTGHTSVDGWQAQVSYSAGEVLPLLWSPVRGGLSGILFIDDDEDGEPDPGEKRVSGVLLRLEGGHRVTDENGVFEWNALGPGTYWLELDRATLPFGLASRLALPLEVRIEVGKSDPVLIPLTPSGRILGRVFLDENRDGVLSPGESGLEEIRIVLRQGEHVERQCLSDENGGFVAAELAPGTYGVAIADGWLRAGWCVTSPALTIEVEQGRTVQIAPIGIAPVERPIRRTYPR